MSVDRHIRNPHSSARLHVRIQLRIRPSFEREGPPAPPRGQRDSAHPERVRSLFFLLLPHRPHRLRAPHRSRAMPGHRAILQSAAAARLGHLFLHAAESFAQSPAHRRRLVSPPPRGDPQHPLPARVLRAVPPVPRAGFPPHRRLAAPRRLRPSPRAFFASLLVRRPRRRARNARNARRSQSGAHQLDHPPKIGAFSTPPHHAGADRRPADRAVREHRVRPDRAAGAGLREVLLSRRRLRRTDRVFVVSPRLSRVGGAARLSKLSAGFKRGVPLRNTVPGRQYRALRRRDRIDRQIQRQFRQRRETPPAQDRIHPENAGNRGYPAKNQRSAAAPRDPRDSRAAPRRRRAVPAYPRGRTGT